MRVVLDSNVLVAAFIARGACAEVFERVITDHELILSPWLLDELERVLLTKLRFDEGRSQRALAVIRRAGTLVDPAPLPEAVCRDPDDDNVLALVRETGAACLVTGDDDLLVLDPFEGIPIVTPRRFLTDFG